MADPASQADRTAFTVEPTERLEGPIDVDAIAASIPPDYTVKGMFCSRFFDSLGSDWKALLPKLKAPPRLGRYLPFQNYPQGDYAVLCAAVAAKRFPRVSMREGVRRLAREDLAVFAESMIGKVVLALAGDARTTLLRVPEAYARVTSGSTLAAMELDAGTVRIEFRGYHGMSDYTLGQMEGVVLHYGGAPRTTVTWVSGDQVTYDVRHKI